MSDFTFPTLPWRNFNNNAGRFLDHSYFASTGSDHPGVDINGNGGGNTDFGTPIRAIADGVVLDARFYATWGNIVLLDHAKHGIESQYAHLSRMTVLPRQAVKKGQIIGYMGRGAGNIYLAHLHFEIRIKKGIPSYYWPSAMFKTRTQARAYIAANYVDGIKYLVSKNAAVV